jgi:dTDP-4-amino-4,6-dideoxygalactose transaminase
MDSEWISSKGPYVEKFEKAWAKRNQRKYGVACSSGTTALTIALRACGIKKGDRVIVPEFTMVATAWAVNYVGATPVFVDCDDKLNINPEKLKEKLATTKNVRAVIPVSVYGRRYSGAVTTAIKNHNKNHQRVWVIEDLAEAHGTLPRGDIACYSLFGNKILSSGEGGICLTSDTKLAELMAWYRSMCFNKEHTFLHPDIGYNFRMTNLQAAVALAQVERTTEILEKRAKIEKWYNKYLPKHIQMPKRDVLWMYDINLGNRRNKVMKRLKERGVDTRYFFKPMSMQPMYNRPYRFLNAFKWSQRGLYLPTYTDLTEEDVKNISQIVIDCL